MCTFYDVIYNDPSQMALVVLETTVHSAANAHVREILLLGAYYGYILEILVNI